MEGNEMAGNTTETVWYERVSDGFVHGVPKGSPEHKRAQTETDPDTHEKLYKPCSRPKETGAVPFRKPDPNSPAAQIARLTAELEVLKAAQAPAPAAPAGDEPKGDGKK